MVIKYTIPELNAIGEMVLLRECISPMSTNQNESPFYRVYLPDTTTGLIPTREPQLANSISADNFLQDYAQFHNHLDQSIQLNREISWQQQHQQQQLYGYNVHHQKKDHQLADSVAEFFKKAQQNFHPRHFEGAARVRRLSEVEAELLGHFGNHLNV